MQITRINSYNQQNFGAKLDKSIKKALYDCVLSTRDEKNPERRLNETFNNINKMKELYPEGTIKIKRKLIDRDVTVYGFKEGPYNEQFPSFDMNEVRDVVVLERDNKNDEILLYRIPKGYGDIDCIVYGMKDLKRNEKRKEKLLKTPEIKTIMEQAKKIIG